MTPPDTATGATVRFGGGRVYAITRTPTGYAVRPQGRRMACHAEPSLAGAVGWASRHAWRRATADRDWREAERRAVASGRLRPGTGR